MTSSSSSHHHDASSASSTPRAGSTSSNGNGNGNGGNYHHHPPPHASSASSTPRAGSTSSNGNGNGNGGNYHHHHPPPHAPSSRPQAQAHLPYGGPCVRIMCSFGGRILPRPGDRQLRYVGGETRIVSVPRSASYALLTVMLARLAPALFGPGAPEPILRYQLPQDDLDSLISVSTDDDVDNLMEEIDRIQTLAATDIKPPRLRLFIFVPSPPDHSSSGAFGSVLSGTGDASADQWFVDQLNAPAPPCHAGRSVDSSIISDNMDYLTGVDAATVDPTPGPPAAAQPKSDTEKAHEDNDDDKPAPVLGAPLAPYVAESTRWPAPPPPYMQHPVYYVPVRPVHYLDAAGRQGGYMPGPVYHVAGGGRNEDLYPSGSVGGVYGVPHPVQPFRQVIYAPPLADADDYSAPEEGKPSEGGSRSS